MRYSVEPRNKIGLGISDKYSPKHLDGAEKSEATKVSPGAFETVSERVIEKTAEAIVNLIGDKIGGTVAKSEDIKITRITSQNASILSGTPMHTICNTKKKIT